MSGLVVDLLFQGRMVRTVAFDRPVLRVGRMRENDIVVDNLAVSRFHARLHLESGRVFLEDGGSENGTFVNDQRVRGRVEVAPGDRIALGKHQLRVRSRHLGEAALDDAPTEPPQQLRSDPWDARETYLAGAETGAALREAANVPSPSSVEEPEPMSQPKSRAPQSDPAPAVPPSGPELAQDAFDFAPMDLAGPDDGEEPTATVLLDEEADAPEAPAAPPLHAGLIVQREGKIERVVPWEGDVFVVGRSSECDLVLGQDEVSRKHARFVRNGDRYEVHDLGSVNGTLVNGRRAERHLLAVGDVIAIESFQLTFVLDRDPIATAMKPPPAKPTMPAAELAGERDSFAMTILQEAMPELDAPAISFEEADAAPAPSPSAEATIANVTLEEALLEDASDGLDMPFESSIDERKELATAQPRGSSRAASVQDLGPATAAARTVTIELRLRVDQLPEPLRRALEEAAAGDLVLPADVRLRTDS
jgi:pSer/pThr/pTyr-binding forkhead associated (FHA) protein